ncbi:alpha/beta fold hydrolase [Nocardioides pocheonensis]|uniref:Alpha/beta hydrolase n=1 Tax=Nocardioides pocheonensis TaxID=661485 RepID=A0A3N0GHX9_9ACTN|nr:alpha/beta hydrolase [Nocardioides pocheonensis]RNM12093.1 alpha/beta hydrolase [Nocardioides pocheonensis]
MTPIHLTNLATFYAETGDGPPILWLSGGGGRASDWGPDYAEAFADGYRSIMFENRGSLGTTCRAPLPWTIADFAADTAELLTKLCDRPAVVIGHSLGALIMLQLAADYPELVTLGISLAGAARGHHGWIGDYMRAEVAYRDAGGSLPPAFSATHYAAMMYPASALQDPDLWPMLREALEDPDAVANTEATVATQWVPCIDFDLVDRLPLVTSPLEIVCFSEDVCAPPAYSAELAELAPQARYHEIEGLGHGSLFGHRPKQVSDFLRELVDNHFDAQRRSTTSEDDR